MDNKVFYLKWFSSIVASIAVVFRALNIPGFHWVDMTLSLIAITGWMYISLKWKDNALLFLNITNSIILTIGILKSFFFH